VVLVPAGVAEHPGPHDLGADPRIALIERAALPGESVVDAAATAGLPKPSGEHPFVQSVPGVPEVCVVALTLTRAEAVE
jgi:hypothetical protein